MGICTDITLYCDKCNGNDIMEGSVIKARQEAKAKGWVRRKNENGEWEDICEICK